MSTDLSNNMPNSVHVSLLCLRLFFSNWDKNVDGTGARMLTTNGSDGLELVIDY